MKSIESVDDSDLFLLFAAGDEIYFEEVITRHQIGVYNFFIRMAGSASEAEDLTQEVFIKLYRSAEHYQKTAKFTTYLYRIARNCWVDALRKRVRRGVMPSLDRGEDEGAGEGLYNRLSSGEKTPLERLEQNEQAEQIQEAIAGLPDDHRAVFVLSEVENLKYAEIADILGVPLGTVKSRMFNAVSKLREKLKFCGLQPTQ